jgi:hypothetical protein
LSLLVIGASGYIGGLLLESANKISVARGTSSAGSDSLTATACAIVFLAGNLHQANNFHRKLDQTGGTGMTSNAMTRLADDALSEPTTLYVFPDWGFFMPFNLLTKNRIEYVLETEQIDKAKCQCKRVAIAFWKAADTSKYTSALTEKGLRGVETKIYMQRDGRPAFYVATGLF